MKHKFFDMKHGGSGRTPKMQPDPVAEQRSIAANNMATRGRSPSAQEYTHNKPKAR